jgi:hypothetical protein
VIPGVDLPASAADEVSSAADLCAAYIRNPIADWPMLTPLQALDAITQLSTVLKCDEIYRAQLEQRKVPDGD